MKLLFCNVGWMEHYKGQNPKDIITGGGSHVDKEGTGHEVCNYSVIRKNIYGYVQPRGDQIKIERLGASIDEDKISGITVIWTASHPNGGTVIVGWYKNATIFRHYQKFKNPSNIHTKNKIDGYRIKALPENVKLLPIDERVVEIPRRVKGGMGQANVWYADTPEAKILISDVKKLVAGKTRKVGKKSKRTDPERNARVEKSAIKVTTKYFQDLGYTVDSVEKDNIGWDLEAVSKKNNLKIEVKGLSGITVTVGLSPNEYSAFIANSSDYRLCIVTLALSDPKLFVCRYSVESERWIVEDNEKAKLGVKPKLSAIINVRI